MGDTLTNNKEYYFTSVEDPILEDGIHLTATDKAVYGILYKYTNKDNKTAFPSQSLLSMMLGGMDKKTIKKSTDWLAHLGILRIERVLKANGSFDNLHYTFNPIPADIIEAAALCRNLKNQKEVLQRIKEMKSVRKAFEAAPATPIIAPVERTVEKKAKPEASKEEVLAIKELSLKLGRDYVLGDKELQILDKAGAFHFVRQVKSGKEKVNTKTKDSYLKAYFIYVKQYKALPTPDVMAALEKALGEHEPKTVANAIKQAKKTNVDITSDAFGEMITLSLQKSAENATYWKQQHYPAKKNSNQDILAKGLANTASNYDEDEDDELYRRMLNPK